MAALRWLLPALALILLLIPQFIAFMDVWLDDGTYSHGLLLLAVTLWLLWQNRRTLASLPRSPMPLALAPLVVMILLLALAQLAGVDLLARLLVLPLVANLVLVLFGWPVTRAVLFPLGLLAFALPIWGLFIPLLQDLAVFFVGLALKLVDIPAVIHLTYIRIPAGDFEIAQGCSGLRYLLVAGAITVLWSGLYLGQWRHRLLYVATGIGAALLCNWIRIFSLIWIGQQSDMQSPLMADHNNFGWYIFAVMLVPLFWFGRRLPHAETTPASGQSPDHVGLETPHWPLVLVTTLLLLLPQLQHLKPAPAPLALQIPLAQAPWQMTAMPNQAWQPDYRGADRQWQLNYRNGDSAFRLHLYAYRYQRNGAELGQPQNRLVPAPWEVQEKAFPCPAQARCLVIQHEQQQHLVMAWQVANGTLVRGRLAMKLHQLLGIMTNTQSAALVALESRCQTPDCRNETETLLQQARPVLSDLLSQLHVGELP